MRLEEIPLTSIELKDKTFRTSTPLTLETGEVKELVRDFFEIYKKKINPRALKIAPSLKEANSEIYPISMDKLLFTNFYVVYDIDETRFTITTQNPREAERIYRLFRNQRVIKPDIDYIMKRMRGNLKEITAALLWQVGAIKTSLGDLNPFFKVDERKNRSPIYIDVKGLPDYPFVDDFITAQAVLLLSDIRFDLICGIEAGSISFATTLSKKLSKPLFFARRKRRYPEASLLEGIKPHESYRRRILLVDDTIVKGWTKEKVIEEIRDRGGIAEDCLVIFDRLEGGSENLKKKGVRLYSLTDRKACLSKRIPKGITLITDEEYKEVEKYFKDPKDWHKKKGFPYYELSPEEH